MPEGINNIDVVPEFVSLEARSLQLTALSPCIDAGVNLPGTRLASDCRGSPRIFNKTVDMGAYEFTMATEAQVLLEGPYATRSMATALQDGGHIPLTVPHASDIQRVKSVSSNVADWVMLQLCTTGNQSVVAARSLFLQPDGSVVDKDGSQGIRLECSPGHYYLVAKHRNHLAVMSADPIAFTNTVVTYDFTTGPDKAFGGTNACVELEPGVWGMIAGDCDGDGKITPVDRAIVSNQVGKAGYLAGDLNLDGVVTEEDVP